MSFETTLGHLLINILIKIKNFKGKLGIYTMDKEDLIIFLKNNLKITLEKDICNQYNDYEYDECIKVSLYILDDEYREVEIDSDYIKLPLKSKL